MPAENINDVLDRLEAADEGAETPAVAAPAAEAPAPAAATSEEDPFDKGADTFDRKYVEKLRQESARYRTERSQARDELGRFTGSFGDIDPGERDLFLDLVKLYRDDPVEAGKWMKTNAEHLLAGVQEAATTEDKPLTRAEYKAMREEEEQAAAIKAMSKDVLKEVTDLGYDPKTVRGRAFMALALEDHNGDIAAAHVAVQAEEKATRDKVIEEYLTGKENDANAPSPVQGGGAAGSAEKPAPRNAKEAGNQALAWLEATGAK